MSDREWRQQIQREERLRHEARRDLERRDAQREQDIQDSYDRDFAYVEQHGRIGAAKLTFAKWTAAGCLFAVAGFFGNMDKGVGEALKFSVECVAFFCVIGIWRAAKYGGFGL